MINYEKLISSVLLSMIFAGHGSGWGGCGCGCDDEEEEEAINEDVCFTDLAPPVENTSFVKPEIYVEHDSTGVTFLIQEIKKGNLACLIQLYTLESSSPTGLKEAVNNLFRWQIEQINIKSKEFFGKDNFKTIGNVSIEELSYVEQMQTIGLMMDVLDCFNSLDVSLDMFSKNMLYSIRKQSFNSKTKHLSTLQIQKKSNVKSIFMIVRNVIFECLTKYVYEYLNLGYDKFGVAFYNKDVQKEIRFVDKIANFYAKNSDSDKYDHLARFLNNKDIVGLKFRDINAIKTAMFSLPDFKEVFVFEENKYKILSGSATVIKNSYKSFVDSILEIYNLGQISSLKGHWATLLNFFNGEAKGKNSSAKKTMLQLSEADNIEGDITVKFKNGLRVDNIVFYSDER